MRNPLPCLLLLLVLVTACSRKPDPVPAPPLTTTIVLAAPQLLNDSTAVLSWSALNNPDFVRYEVVRQADSAATGYTFRIYGGPNNVTYRDNDLPYTTYVQYQVIGLLASGQTIASNVVACRRPEIKMVYGVPTDVQFDSQRRLLYFFGRDGTIQQYDVATDRLVRTLQVGQAIGHCSLGTFGGQPELYVPCADGRVLMYDATTLAKVDELQVMGSPLTDVLASNNQLFVAATYGDALRSFDRATKANLSSGHAISFPDMRLFKVPGTSTDFIGVGLSTAPTPQTYFSFTAAGTYGREVRLLSESTRSLSARAFEFFPAGDRYITGAYGDVFTRTMGYVATLPYRREPLFNRRQEYTCFSFDAAAQTIYAGTTTRTIEVLSMQDYSPVRTLKTRRYPFKLFRDGTHGFVSISLPNSVENYFYSATLFRGNMLIEHIK
jgi:hypothetical protein